jgi:hypothetical protein
MTRQKKDRETAKALQAEQKREKRKLRRRSKASTKPIATLHVIP